MPLRIAFDLDGVLADFAGEYQRILNRLFPERQGDAGPAEDGPAEDASRPAGTFAAAQPDGSNAEDLLSLRGGASTRRLSRRRQKAVWRQIRSTSDFWMTLDAVEPGVIARIYDQSSRLGWDTFFVTQRPATAGDTVQRQTQRWLVAHGFPLPSVIPQTGSRGSLAAALELDFLVDDQLQNCVDTLSASTAVPILVDREGAAATETNARRLGIEICSGPGASVDLLVEASDTRRLPSWLRAAQRRLSRQP